MRIGVLLFRYTGRMLERPGRLAGSAGPCHANGDRAGPGFMAQNSFRNRKLSLNFQTFLSNSNSIEFKTSLNFK
jgi:hypothetical protein